MFKQKCDEFLTSITTLRSTAINQAVAEAIRLEHTPFEVELLARRDAVIAELKAKTAEEIRILQERLESNINAFTTETSAKLENHRKLIADAAEEKAKASYDTFILGVSKLVDDAQI